MGERCKGTERPKKPLAPSRNRRTSPTIRSAQQHGDGGASAGIPEAAVYSGSKGAVDAITRGLAEELGPRKIRVNAIAPGGVETECTYGGGIVGSDFRESNDREDATRSLGQPDDIARIAVFLASEDSAWLTGERLAASGGYR